MTAKKKTRSHSSASTVHRTRLQRPDTYSPRKKRTMVILVALCFLGVLAVVLGATVFVHRNGIEYYFVERRDIMDRVVISGEVTPFASASLGFEQSGRVAEVLVDEGDSVVLGDVLVRLDTATLEARLRDALAYLDIQHASLDEVLRGSRVEESDIIDSKVVSAERELERVTEKYTTLVESAYETLLTSGLDAYSQTPSVSVSPPDISGFYSGDEEGIITIVTYNSNAESGFSYRVEGLATGTYEASFTNPTPLGSSGLYVQFNEGGSQALETWIVEIPNKRSSVYAANLAAYHSSLEDRDRYVTDAENTLFELQAEQNLDRAGSSSEEIRRARASVIQAQARVDELEASIEERLIRAPFDGVVSAFDLHVGELVSANEVVLTLLSQGGLEVEIQIPEIDVPRVSFGDSVDITLDAFGDDIVFPGTLISIDPASTNVDGVRVYEAVITFDSEPVGAVAGMTADASVVIDSASDVVSIPLVLLGEGDSDRYDVLVSVGESSTESRTLELGLRGSDGMVEVVSGLSEGDVVVIQKNGNGSL